MGRGAGEPAGIGPEDDRTTPEIEAGPGDRRGRSVVLSTVSAAQKQMLENVRRALGKLVTHTTVHEIRLEDAQVLSDPAVDVLVINVPAEPVRQDPLEIPASVHPAGIPVAEPGGGGVDLASVATVVSADSALSEARTNSYAVDIAYDQVPCYEIQREHWSTQSPGLGAAELDVVGGDVRDISLTRMKTAAVGSLPVDRVQVKPGAHANVSGALRPMRVGTKTSITRIFAVPMVCRSIIERRGPAGNLREREKLAAAAKSSLENVVLIGLFRNVPVTAVSRLTVDERAGELSIWLKPESAVGPPPKQVSLLVGRDKSTGKMIQTVV